MNNQARLRIRLVKYKPGATYLSGGTYHGKPIYYFNKSGKVQVWDPLENINKANLKHHILWERMRGQLGGMNRINNNTNYHVNTKKYNAVRKIGLAYKQRLLNKERERKAKAHHKLISSMIASIPKFVHARLANSPNNIAKSLRAENARRKRKRSPQGTMNTSPPKFRTNWRSAKT
jgi:hypothetical protein